MKDKAMKTTTDALEILDSIIGDNAEMREMIAEESDKLHVAQVIYAARKNAGLTQKELSRRIGTSQSVIARLEDADYSGHSLMMLRRIANALDMSLEINLKPNQTPGYHPAFVEDAAIPNIKFSTHKSLINVDAYRNSTPSKDGKEHHSDQTRQVYSL